MSFNPLELALLTQLVQSDKNLNRDIRIYFSNVFSKIQKDDGKSFHECMNGDSYGHLFEKTTDNNQSNDATALKNVVLGYNKIKEWINEQRGGRPSSAGPSAAIDESLIVRYLQKCRHLGLIAEGTYSQPESSETVLESKSKRPVKVFCDGVFDLMHAGHFNAIRQAAQLGDELYVGVCADDEVLRAKGVHPLYNVEERAEIVKACKWVTDVIIGSPYDIDLTFFKSTGCDFVAHGNDLALNGQGVDCYDEIRKAGFLKCFKRTEGISTSTIIARLLGVVDTVPNAPQISCPTPAHQFIRKVGHDSFGISNTSGTNAVDVMVSTNDTNFDNQSDTSTTTDDNLDGAALAMKQTVLSTRRLAQFLGSPKVPSPGSRIVYTDGSFDVFHNGHVRIFERAKGMGDFLIVGIYDDSAIRQWKGPGYPIQGMLDRALSVMAMRYVDEVVMGAPVDLTEHFIQTFKINTVVRGSVLDVAGTCHQMQLNKLKTLCEIIVVESESEFTTEVLIDRIKGNRDRLKHSIAKRKAKEKDFYNQCAKSECHEI